MSPKLAILWVFNSFHIWWISAHLVQTNWPQSRQNPVAIDVSHFSQCIFCGSLVLDSISRISNKPSAWKSVCSPETPVGGSRVVRRQVGQHRVCPSRSWTTRRPRHFLQKEWKHGSSLASVKVSRQTEHSSWAVILFSAFSATPDGVAILYYCEEEIVLSRAY